MSVVALTGTGMDSLGTLIVLKTSGIEADTVSAYNYESIDNSVLETLRNAKSGDRIFVTNITPSENACEAITHIIPQGVTFLLVDHHYSRRYVSAYPWALFDPSKSSSLLLFEKLKSPSNVKGLVDAIDSWAMWKISSVHRSRAERINSLLSFLGSHEFVDTFSEDPDADTKEPLVALAACLEKRKEKYVKDVASDLRGDTNVYIDGLGYKFKVVISKEYASDVAKHVLSDQEYEDLDYVAVVNPFNNRCSLRARPGVDVRVVAQAMHGGGNWRKDTAGFQVPIKECVKARVVELLQKINY